MDINRRTDYAIRILLELARRPGRPLSVRELAEHQGVPYAFARGIQRDLVAAGLVDSFRGVKGGIALAKPPSDISLLDIIGAVQGEPSCAVCTRDSEWCTRMGGCSVHEVWRQVDGLVADYLGRQDLAGLAGQRAKER